MHGLLAVLLATLHTAQCGKLPPLATDSRHTPRSGASNTGTSHVIKLTDLNWGDTNKGRGKPWLIIFCPSSNPKCVKMAHIWPATAKILHEQVNVGYVDTDHYRLGSQLLGMKRIPHFVYMKDGQYAWKRKSVSNHVELINWALTGAKDAPFKRVPSPPGIASIFLVAIWTEFIKVGEILKKSPFSAALLLFTGGTI
mmetsp:Transcript_16260/g.22816  ORF Transcript_16260/g.22816 Transcript_16260/m.22816 type:complete len:197 (-) Transcript_16260:100-690(-)